ncbi:MAG: sigma 54-interacting transcriptional regulator, partial [Alphaproteobacteria bacterium]
PQRLEKELFGSFHDDSAPGLLQLVDGGSLLLDEVSALPMETQGKILNLLQDGAYYKLGSNQKTPVDVRVLATTAENIEDKVRAGHFRKDLYYRLNVFPIALPPLRQYKNAIPTLISQLSALRFSEQALMALKSYSWPGNIKQLHNVLEWLSLMYLHKEDLRAIDFDQLPQELRNFAPSYGAHNFGNDNSTLFNDVLDLSLRDARESFERYYLVSQINRFDGNISKTAEFIGMERSALHRKLKSLEVFPDDKQNVA